MQGLGFGYSGGMNDDLPAPRSYTREEISDWIQRYRASGLTLGAFAEDGRQIMEATASFQGQSSDFPSSTN